MALMRQAEFDAVLGVDNVHRMYLPRWRRLQSRRANQRLSMPERARVVTS
jgi:hypothetical protein